MDRATQRLAKTYAAAFNGGAGAEVLEDLQRRFGARLSYVKGDPHETAFREGQRSVVVTIQTLMALAKGAPEAAPVEVAVGAEEES